MKDKGITQAKMMGKGEQDFHVAESNDWKGDHRSENEGRVRGQRRDLKAIDFSEGV